ncbi:MULTISPECIES: alpha/beta fold hydrolase [Streptomyces]|nr:MULTISPECIES: alpha/beta fold hydrolase [Streptomyces]MCX4615417.1 alpha/beta hydrolase [Streptomyces mirabilis]MCX5355954.1 alpha/beta hydrolase [Streptomyces mirabilis]
MRKARIPLLQQGEQVKAGSSERRWVEHLGVPELFLLGHSHGGFVAQYHALHHPERIPGVILYESAPLTGPEHGAVAMRLVQSFAALHADHPELPGVLAAFQVRSPPSPTTHR